mmetsp:Transcript_19978/g.62612  ORF Transcript_19978/g.62612 Transcript_19978/m.62612 type:complete len:90 (+) Transcript_19978:1045-1314(+)
MLTGVHALRLGPALCTRARARSRARARRRSDAELRGRRFAGSRETSLVRARFAQRCRAAAWSTGVAPFSGEMQGICLLALVEQPRALDS